MHTTWVSPLRIQTKGTKKDTKLQTGTMNNLLLPAPVALEPGNHMVEWPWEVQVGPKQCSLLAPWGVFLEKGGSETPQVLATWPT